MLVGVEPSPRLTNGLKYVPSGRNSRFYRYLETIPYGSTPGLGRYKFNIDINLDFVIDIYDLTTLAASLGESY